MHRNKIGCLDFWIIILYATKNCFKSKTEPGPERSCSINAQGSCVDICHINRAVRNTVKSLHSAILPLLAVCCFGSSQVGGCGAKGSEKKKRKKERKTKKLNLYSIVLEAAVGKRGLNSLSSRLN